MKTNLPWEYVLERDDVISYRAATGGHEIIETVQPENGVGYTARIPADVARLAYESFGRALRTLPPEVVRTRPGSTS